MTRRSKDEGRSEMPTLSGFRRVEHPIQQLAAEVRDIDGKMVWQDSGNWVHPKWDLFTLPVGYRAIESFRTPSGGWRCLSDAVKIGPHWELLDSMKGKAEIRVFPDYGGYFLWEFGGASDIPSVAGDTQEAAQLEALFQEWQSQWEGSADPFDESPEDLVPPGGWKAWRAQGLRLSRRLSSLLGPDSLVLCQFLGSLGNGRCKQGLALFWEQPDAVTEETPRQCLDPMDIPPGEFCYRVFPLAEGEVLIREVEQFGKGLREYPFASNLKQVLCPYWLRTDYGTVRCKFLGVEVVDELDPAAVEKLAQHLGSADAARAFPVSWELPDELKICGIREDEDS